MVDKPLPGTNPEAPNLGEPKAAATHSPDSQMPSAEASAPLNAAPLTQPQMSAEGSYKPDPDHQGSYQQDLDQQNHDHHDSDQQNLDNPDPEPNSGPHSEELGAGTSQVTSKDKSKIQLPSSFEPIRLKTGTILLLASLLVIPGILLSRGSDPFDIGPFDAINFGANLAPMVLAGEPWRMLSSLFMHFGIAHLALNFLGLALFGYELEKRTGALGLIAVFILTGIAGSAAHVAWYAFGFGQVALAAGASGGILGLNGLLLVLSAAKPNPRALFNTKALMWLGAINLGYGFVTPGIDNAAHIGGFLAGVLLGTIYLLMRLVVKR